MTQSNTKAIFPSTLFILLAYPKLTIRSSYSIIVVPIETILTCMITHPTYLYDHSASGHDSIKYCVRKHSYSSDLPL